MARGDVATPGINIDMLEERLHLLDYIINGTTSGNDGAQDKSTSAITRLRNLERKLNILESNSSAAADVLAFQKEHPHILNGISSSDQVPPVSTDALAAVVLAHQKTYSSVSANLSAIKDTPLPDSAVFTNWSDLGAKLEKLAAKQQTQAAEIADMRMRSAVLVEKWYQRGVLEMGDKWADWEERLREVEILVRREEAAKKRDQEGIV